MEEQEKAIAKKMYICDPSANTPCSKSGCVLRGGPCFMTASIEYADIDSGGHPAEATIWRVLQYKALQSQIDQAKDVRRIWNKYSAPRVCIEPDKQPQKTPLLKILIIALALAGLFIFEIASIAVIAKEVFG